MKRRLKLKKGISMPVSVLFFVVTAGITIGATTLADSSHKVSVAATNKQQANSLAETGVYAFYDNLWRQLRTDGTYPSSLTTKTLVSNIDGVNKKVGEYSASIVSVTKNTSDLGDGMTQEDYTFTVLGYGKAPNGTDAEINATFSGSQVRQAAGTASGTAAFLPAAMQSNTDISVTSELGFKTISPLTSPGSAHVFANQNVDWKRKDGSRNGILGTSIKIDGHLMVSKSSDTSFYDFTQSRWSDYGAQGLYHSTGDSRLNIGDDNVVPSAQRVFPSQAQVDGWTTTWEKSIKSNATSSLYTAPLSSSTLTATIGVKTLNAPAYIDGNLSVEAGDILQLMPTSSDPAKNIVMVTGDILNSGKIMNCGVTLYCIGKYSDTPASQYSVTAPLLGSLKAALNNASLVSGSVDPDAIKISSDASSSYGLVYSAKGGVQITGNGSFDGAIVAGSSAPGNGVSISPSNGGSFTISYSPDSLNNKKAFPVSTGAAVDS
ncbi:MAG: hypothetical protein ABUL72_00215, partial [Armatimonadota bacterium]